MGERYSAGTARMCRRRPNGVSNNGYISGSGFSNVDGLCVRNYCLFISSYYYPSSGYSWITGACVTTTTTTTSTSSSTSTSTSSTSTTTSTSSTSTTTSTTSTAAPVAPSGGSISTSGGYRYHVFTGSGTFSAGSATRSIQVMVIGGGGGGGGSSTYAGGGGGGEFNLYNLTSQSNSYYSVTIGAGGSIASTGTYSDFQNNSSNGGAYGYNSGDGAYNLYIYGSYFGGSPYDPGNWSTVRAGGGGSGYGGNGENGSSSGAGRGGYGYTNTWPFGAAIFGGGGGGDSYYQPSNASQPASSTGLGGMGSAGSNGSGAIYSGVFPFTGGSSAVRSAVSGTANSGFGGGGSASGGSGVVIIRYTYP